MALHVTREHGTGRRGPANANRCAIRERKCKWPFSVEIWPQWHTFGLRPSCVRYCVHCGKRHTCRLGTRGVALYTDLSLVTGLETDGSELVQRADSPGLPMIARGMLSCSYGIDLVV